MREGNWRKELQAKYSQDSQINLDKEWQIVAKKLDKERKRRPILFILLFSFICLGTFVIGTNISTGTKEANSINLASENTLAISNEINNQSNTSIVNNTKNNPRLQSNGNKPTLNNTTPIPQLNNFSDGQTKPIIHSNH
jgi:predicted PurR-regulated permease PerM